MVAFGGSPAIFRILVRPYPATAGPDRALTNMIFHLSCARSSARIERLVAVQEAAGSNPAGRTTIRGKETYGFSATGPSSLKKSVCRQAKLAFATKVSGGT